MKTTLASVLLLALLAVGGCKATKTYPDPYPGWHNADYTSVFGRLQRVPSKVPGNAPVWIVRWGLGSDAYSGEFALTPQDKFVGYSGGEQVELQGAIRQAPLPDFPATWYEVQSVKMWSNYK